jgi:hypothetical protein
MILNAELEEIGKETVVAQLLSHSLPAEAE